MQLYALIKCATIEQILCALNIEAATTPGKLVQCKCEADQTRFNEKTESY
jgi:hypothetical protein